jgi:hypothetical protein
MIIQYNRDSTIDMYMSEWTSGYFKFLFRSFYKWMDQRLYNDAVSTAADMWWEDNYIRSRIVGEQPQSPLK